MQKQIKQLEKQKLSMEKEMNTIRSQLEKEIEKQMKQEASLKSLKSE
jgi:molecular chaperone GrpE (heat shock protein)